MHSLTHACLSACPSAGALACRLRRTPAGADVSDAGCDKPCADEQRARCGCADDACGSSVRAGLRPGEHARRWIVYDLAPVYQAQWAASGGGAGGSAGSAAAPATAGGSANAAQKGDRETAEKSGEGSSSSGGSKKKSKKSKGKK